MKKTTFLFTLLLSSITTSLFADVVTTESTAGSMITADSLKKLSDTGAHFALMPVSTNSATANKWFGRTTNLTAEYVWTLTNGTDSYYKISRVSDGTFLQNTTTITFGDESNAANLSVLHNVINDGSGTEATPYDNEYHIQIHKDGNKSYRLNCYSGNNDFRAGAGGWATYVAYGPFYVINVVEVDEARDTLGTEQVFITSGTTEISAPAKTGYLASNITLTGTKDETVIVAYSRIPNWTDLQTAYNNLSQYPVGTGLGQYTDALDNFDEVLATAKEYLDNQTNDITLINKVDSLISELNTHLTHLTLNLPQAGMYLRIKGGFSSNYLTSNGTDGTNIPMQAETTEATIYYYDGASLINYANGKGINNTHSQCAASGTIDQQVFAEGATLGTYTMYATNSAQNSKWLYDNSTKLDRYSTNNADHCKWILEQVTELPYSADYTANDTSYGTLYLPVAATLTGTNTHVYGAKLSEDSTELKAIELEAVEGTITIPAETGVILRSSNATLTLNVTTTDKTVTGNALSGTYKAQASETDSVYVLRVDETTGNVDFYKNKICDVKANRAYYAAVATAESYALAFDSISDTVIVDTVIVDTVVVDTEVLSDAKAAISYGMPKAEVETLQSAIYTYAALTTPTADDAAVLRNAIETFKTNVAQSESNQLYLPTGYYYFKGLATDRGPYLYSDFVSKGNTATFHSTNIVDADNKYIWHIVNNGTTITVSNGEGLPIITANNTSATAFTTFQTLTFSNYNAAYQGIYFTEAINLTNTSFNGYITTWTAGGLKASDNRWTFEDVNTTAGIYDVVIEGNENGYVTYNNQNAQNGGFFVAENISESDVTVKAMENWETALTIADKRITVTYTQTTPNWTDLQTAYDNLSQYPIGSSLGQYTDALANTDEVLATAQELLSNQTNDITLINKVDSLISELNAHRTGLTLNLPQAGMYLRIKGGYSGNYMTAAGGSDNGMVPLNADGTTAESIYYYDGASLINYTTGKGFISTYAQCAAGGTIETQTFSARTDAIGYYYILSNYSGSKIFYDGETVVNRNSSDNAARCKWILEEVTELPYSADFTANGISCGTLYLPVAVTLSSADVHVYGAQLSEYGDYLEPIELEAEEGIITIPAETGVIIKIDNDSTAITLNLTTTDKTVTGNELSGTYKAVTSLPESSYVLQLDDETRNIEFHQKEEANVEANRAYYEADAIVATDVLTLLLKEEVVDAIEGIAVNKPSTNAVYDLTGRKVTQARKGIFVQNGHKYLVK